MEKRFERALLLCPEQYSLSSSLHEILALMAQEVRTVDVVSAIKSQEVRLNSQMFRFPHVVRKRWERHFLNKVNSMIIQLVDSVNPDLVLVYNSLYLVPSTCMAISKRSKLVFFMGDSPFYTPQNNYYLSCLPYADLILSPDSYWAEQLVTMGLNKVTYFMPGTDNKSYFRIDPSLMGHEEQETEVLYVGSCYLNSWGYKKAFLMSHFTSFNFRLYGNSAWRRWFSFFPELEAVYSDLGFIPQERLNRMYNMTRIIPVDGNPGIISGVHLRMFEALAAGALPLIEYRRDVDSLLFRGFNEELPVIRDYSKAAGLASRYLNNEQERQDLVSAMNTYLAREYSHASNAERLTEALK